MIVTNNKEVLQFIPTKETLYFLKLNDGFLFENLKKEGGLKQSFNLSEYLEELKGGII